MFEKGEIYVARNIERIKTAIKTMFETKEIIPFSRTVKTDNPAVTIKFKFAPVKNKSQAKVTKKESVINSAKAKIVAKKVIEKRAKNQPTEKKTTKPKAKAKGLKINEAEGKRGGRKKAKTEEVREFDDDEDVPRKYL